MRSAIVDPVKPQVIKASRQFLPSGRHDGQAGDEFNAYISKFGGGQEATLLVATPPITGEYRIRMSASALLVPGFDEVPLQTLMGMPVDGDHIEKPHQVIGKNYLSNNPDEPQIIEFRGRIENIPYSMTTNKKDGSIVHRRELRTQNIFDNGEPNNGINFSHHQRAAYSVARGDQLDRVRSAPWLMSGHPSITPNILFDSPLRQSNEQAYVREVLERFMGRAYRRQPQAQKLIDLLSLWLDSAHRSNI